VRHRFLMLSAAKHFADCFGYSVCMLWGVTGAVSYCRFEDLFAPVPGIRIVNLSPEKMTEVANRAMTASDVMLGNSSFRVLRPGEAPRGSFFSWDLVSSGALAKLRSASWPQVLAVPAATIRADASAFARAHGLDKRLGVRVRVEESPSRNRKPHRVERELNEALKSIIRLPWHTKTFVATDSEYMQQMLASHFPDTKYLAKRFDHQEATGRYVHRQDKEAMVTFLKEIFCLCLCRKIVSVGGFLNEDSVRHKIIQKPYEQALPWTAYWTPFRSPASHS